MKPLLLLTAFAVLFTGAACSGPDEGVDTRTLGQLEEALSEAATDFYVALFGLDEDPVLGPVTDSQIDAIRKIETNECPQDRDAVAELIVESRWVITLGLGEEGMKAWRDHLESQGTLTSDWRVGLGGDVSTEYVSENGAVLTLDSVTVGANRGLVGFGAEGGAPWVLQDGRWRLPDLGGC